MKNIYSNLIEQTYYFPQGGFELRNNILHFHGINLQYLINKYGTPFRLTYLPKIGDQINRAKNWFKKAMKKMDYKGKYYYCYCTKCCHFHHVVNEALKHDIHIETSSSFDIDLIIRLWEKGSITKDTMLVHNGHKTKCYLDKIVQLHEMGFKNSIIILDSIKELDRLAAKIKSPVQIGLRLATTLKPQSDYYTSRLGIVHEQMLPFYQNKIKDNPLFKLKMVHFFVDDGIKDNLYYWGEFQKAIETFIELKKACPELDALNMGGGLPIRNSLGFEYDYPYMISEIVKNIKEACNQEGVEEPDLFTEFGKYTVGESGAIIFSVLEHKKQNDLEQWYIIDNSIMNTIPDTWGIQEKFILMPVNKWEQKYTRVNIGGISCDHSDYYNSEELNREVLLPLIDENDEEPLYLGFFHTGAYQDAISGYGGIKHCLIPAPKYVIIDRDEAGNFTTEIYRDQQQPNEMLEILGY